MTLKQLKCAAIAAACLLKPRAFAAGCDYSNTLVSAACQRVVNVAQNGSWDIYVTGYGLHFGGYGAQRRTALNAQSWGGGFSKHWVDAKGNEDILLAVAFLDSESNIEPIVGYARQWYSPPLGGLSLGGGYFLGLSSRPDVFHRLPFPLPLPVGSLRYHKASVFATFIPKMGSLNHGYIAFFFGRYEF